MKESFKALKKNKSIIHEQTVGQVISGLKGVPALLSLTCQDGGQLLIRNKKMSQIQNQANSAQGYFWFLLTGQFGLKSDIENLKQDIKSLEKQIHILQKTLQKIPIEMNPCAMMSILLMYLQTQSKFFKSYGNLKRSQLYKPALQDSLKILANLPIIFSLVYHKKNQLTCPKRAQSLDFIGKICELTGKQSRQFLNTFLLCYCDNGSGSVGSHTAKMIGSTLSDPFKALAGAFNAISAPLHGGAIDSSLAFLESDIERRIQESIEKKLPIPGFGHASFRQQDPRFQILRKLMQDKEEKSGLMAKLEYAVERVPSVIKARNKSPNGDLMAAVCIDQYGFKFFGSSLLALSRSLGILSNYVLDRGIQSPIQYTQSMTLKDLAKKPRKKRTSNK